MGAKDMFGATTKRVDEKLVASNRLEWRGGV